MYILIGAIFVVITAILLYLAKRSVEKLDTSVLPYYDFGVWLPKSGSWSVVVFLIIISILALVVLLLTTRSGITIKPA